MSRAQQPRLLARRLYRTLVPVTFLLHARSDNASTWSSMTSLRLSKMVQTATKTPGDVRHLEAQTGHNRASFSDRAVRYFEGHASFPGRRARRSVFARPALVTTRTSGKHNFGENDSPAPLSTTTWQGPTLSKPPMEPAGCAGGVGRRLAALRSPSPPGLWPVAGNRHRQPGSCKPHGSHRAHNYCRSGADSSSEVRRPCGCG